jgi:hypothetical protein
MCLFIFFTHTLTRQTHACLNSFDSLYSVPFPSIPPSPSLLFPLLATHTPPKTRSAELIAYVFAVRETSITVSLDLDPLIAQSPIRASAAADINASGASTSSSSSSSAPHANSSTYVNSAASVNSAMSSSIMMANTRGGNSSSNSNSSGSRMALAASFLHRERFHVRFAYGRAPFLMMLRTLELLGSPVGAVLVDVKAVLFPDTAPALSSSSSLFVQSAVDAAVAFAKSAQQQKRNQNQSQTQPQNQNQTQNQNHTQNQTPNHTPPLAAPIHATLNDEQRIAVANILHRPHGLAPYVIFGPPGTGTVYAGEHVHFCEHVDGLDSIFCLF